MQLQRRLANRTLLHRRHKIQHLAGGTAGVKVTEKHYSPWVKARHEQLEAGVAKSWEWHPIVQREMKRGKRAVVPISKRA